MRLHLKLLVAAAAVLVLAVFTVLRLNGDEMEGGVSMDISIQLPGPAEEGEVSLERAIAGRRSRRSFSDRPLALAQAGQVLWSAQGVTQDRLRAAPSAGATYPLEIFIAVGDETVEGLKPGVYRYGPAGHGLERVLEGDIRDQLARAALGQMFVAEAPMVIVIAADYGRTTGRYGERGVRYVHMEVGHAGGNIYLQCEALGLGTVAVGAFRDERVEELTGMTPDLDALYIMPVGYAR